MNKIIVCFIFIIATCNSFVQAQTVDSLSIEQRNEIMLEKMKKNPILNSIMGYDYNTNLVMDSIPEVRNLCESYLDAIISLFENDLGKFNDIVIGTHKKYVEIEPQLAENSLLHILARLCVANLCVLNSNYSGYENWLLECEQFLQKYDKNNTLRLITMPALSSFYYNIGNKEAGKYWMKVSLRFMDDTGFRKTLLGPNILADYADKLAEDDESNNALVDSLYCEGIETLKNIDSEGILVKSHLSRYLGTLVSSGRIIEALDVSETLEEILDKNQVLDAEMYLTSKLVQALIAYYTNETGTLKQLISEIDDVSLWLFRNQIPKLPNELRSSYWENELSSYYSFIPSMAKTLDSPEYNKMIYNMQLITKGALLSSNCSFEDLSQKSNNKKLKEMYLKFDANRKELDKLKTITDMSLIKERQHLSLEQLEIENAMLKEIEKEGSIIDWSYFDLDSVRAHLGKNEIAIEFFVSEDRDRETDDSLYCAMVISPKNDAPRQIDLFYGSALVEMHNKAEAIYENVWKNILEDEEIRQCKVKNIYFSPAGGLCNLPIENALFLAPKKYKAYRMSSTRYIVSAKSKISQKDAALFGGMWYNIDYPPTDDDSSFSSTMFEYLPYSLTEVKKVKSELRKWKSQIYDGREATEDNFKALSGKSPEVLLLSTHGIFSNEKGDNNIGMNRTGLLMSGAENSYYKDLQKGEEDGFLFASEIEDLNLANTDLVVLSGCRTGLGSISSEGVFGLQRGFKRAGVNTIIMSLSDVRDDASEKFVTEFFKCYAKTHDKQKAFSTSLNKLKSSFPDFNVWSSFVMIDGNS